jgi:hypothetical protein
MLGLVGPFHRNAEVGGLVLAQHRELRPDLLKVEPRDFFIEVLRKAINADGIAGSILPEVELS